MSVYVFHSALWSLFGFILGFITAKYVSHEKVCMKGELMSLGKPTMRQALGIAIVLMSLVSVIAVGMQSSQLSESAKCNANYAQAVSDAFKARDKVSGAFTDAARDKAVAEGQLWLGFVANAPAAGQQGTEEQRQKSLGVLNTYLEKNSAYVKALDNTKQSREVFPLPANRCPQPSTDWRS